MKLLIDMNLSPRWVQYLTEAGFSACHWTSIGSREAPDESILAHAAAEKLVVLTHDLDFSAILAASKGISPSVAQVRSEVLAPEAIGPQVVAALKQMQTVLAEGALISVDPKRARVRMLPLP